MKESGVTYAEMIKRLKKHGFKETEASLTMKLKRGAFAASFSWYEDAFGKPHFACFALIYVNKAKRPLTTILNTNQAEGGCNNAN